MRTANPKDKNEYGLILNLKANGFVFFLLVDSLEWLGLVELLLLIMSTPGKVVDWNKCY